MATVTAETELAVDLLSGKAGAFDRFVETYGPRILQYTILMCGHRDDAEEVVQETLLRVFEKLEQLREPEHLKAWVFRIARNACYMRRRKSVFAPVQELSLDELMPDFRENGGERRMEIADWTELPDAQAISAQLREILDRSIQELPEIYRAVILLRDVEELSTEETAEVLEISGDSVKTRLHRARLAVRRSLDKYFRVAQAMV